MIVCKMLYPLFPLNNLFQFLSYLVMKKIKVDKESCELLQSIAIRHRL